MIAYYAYHDRSTKQRFAQFVHDTKRTEYNNLDTIFICLYNDNRVLR